MTDSSPLPGFATRTPERGGGHLKRNALLMSVNQFGRIGLQGAYFVVAARSLGVQDFGALSSVIALVSVISPFGGLGAVNLLIKHVARDRTCASRWFATTTAVTLAGGCATVAILLVVGPLITPRQVTLELLAAVAVAELVFARLLEVAGAVYQGQERMARTAWYPLCLHGGRLVAAVLLVAGTGRATLGMWVATYCATTVILASAMFAATCIDTGCGPPVWSQYRAEWREGVLFSVGLSSQTVYNDIDKVMLAKLGSLDATGIYTAAYRLIDMAFAPMRAMLNAAYPRFFALGKHGVGRANAFTRRLARPALAYCLFASVCLFAFAGLVPVVLGSAYEPSVGALRGLAVLPLLKGIHYLAADTLTGAGHQGSRSAAQVGVAAANIALNFVLIPRFALAGAVAASIASDTALAVCLWILLRHFLHRERTGPCAERPLLVPGGSDARQKWQPGRPHCPDPRRQARRTVREQM